MKKILALVCAVAFAAITAGTVFAADAAPAAAAPAAAAPAAAPKGLEFKFKTSSGKDYTQDDIKGKGANLLFVQMACRQCRLELDDINKNPDAFKDKVTIVLVDMNSDAAMKAWASIGYKMEPVLDPGFDLPEMLGVRSTPATVKVDKDLKVVSTKYGYKPGDLDALLK